MIPKILKYFSLLLFLVGVQHAIGAKRYWVGSGSNLNWNTTANWSTSSGGASGASVPGSADTVYFNGGGIGKCVLDVGINVKRFEISSAFTDTIVQNKKTITIGSSGFVQTGGTFYGDSTNISLSGAFSMTAGKFRSTQSVLTCSGNFTADVNTGTFLHNNGKVLLDNTCTITGPGSIYFYKLELYGQTTQKTFTILSTVAVAVVNDFIMSGNGGVVVNTGNIYARGDIYTTTVQGGGGNAYVYIDGTGNQTIYGSTSNIFTGRLQNVTINKTSGNLYLQNNIAILGNFTYTAGTIVPGTSTVNFYGTKTITGSVSLYNAAFSNSTAASVITLGNTTNITVTNTLDFNGNTGAGWYLTVNTGTITAQGNITDNIQQGGGSGSTVILISGTGNQTFTGAGSTSKHFLPAININKSSGTLTLASTICVGGHWTYTAGTIDPGTSEVVFCWGKTISGSHTLNAVGFYYTGSVITVTVSAGTVLTVNGTYKHYGSNPSALILNSGTIEVKGNIDLSTASGLGGGTTLMKICGTGNQTITGHTLGDGLLPVVEINKPSGTLSLTNKVSTGGSSWTYTAGTVNAGTSTVRFFNQVTITGSMSLNHVELYSGGSYTATISSGTQLSVNNLIFSGSTLSTGHTVNSGTITVSGNITHQRLQYGGGTTNIILNGSGNQTIYGRGTVNSYRAWLPNLIINKSGGNVTVDSSVIVKGRLTLKGSSNYEINGTNGGELWVGGDSITLGSTSTANGGSALIKIEGASVAQRLSGSGSGLFPKIKIDKTGSNALTISGTVNVGNDWTYTAGTLSVTGSTVSYDKSLTITGTHTLNNVTFAPASSSTVGIASGTTLTVPGNLTLGGNAGLTVNTGTIAATGSITVTNTVTTGGGSATINVNGSGNQTITGTSGTSAVPLCNLNINKSAGTLTLDGASLSVAGALTCTSGTTTVSSSNTVYFYGSASLNAPAITFNNVTCAKGVRTLAGHLNVSGNLSILSDPATVWLDASGGNYNISLQGNWSNASKFKSGLGWLKCTGSNNQTMSQPISETDTIGRFEINKAGGTFTLNSKVNITDSLKFVSGKIISSSSNPVVFKSRAAATGMSSVSFVSGPARKIGNTAFTFPSGKASNYQPIAISAPTSATDAFTAEYFNAGQTYGTAKDSTIDSLSTCEYWNLDRTVGASSVYVTSGWNANSCDIDSANAIGYWDASASKWKNAWGDNFTGNRTQGTATTLGLQFTFGPIIIIKTKLCKQFSVEAGDYTEKDVYDIGSPFPNVILGGSPMNGNNPTATQTFQNQNFTYSWQPTTGLTQFGTGPSSEHPTATPSVTTNYTVSVTNFLGCVKSDVVTFVVTRPIAVLKKEMEPGYYIAKARYLAFEYDEDYRDNNSLLTYKIVELSTNTVKMSAAQPLAVLYGTNRYLLDLTSTSQFPQGFYSLEVVNEKDEHHYLRFQVP